MADTMQFDLVSPERRLASIEAQAVQIPGTEGNLTAMPDHAPTITTLRPGLVTVTAADGSTSRYAVTGGFAEIGAEATSVLAERAYSSETETIEQLRAHLEDARAQAAKAPSEERDAAELFVADLVELIDAMS
ncbi:ATP synthase F1 subunit epsilon [Rhodobacteraceae bacterium WD3A24]|nr:ATP synthase F1 subunit epsilon [Rhodobacteraceae bacterium WD3A24]